MHRQTRSCRFRGQALIGFLLAAGLSATAWAGKTDTIVLANGNVVTGEVKKLEYGKLRYSTDSMGTVMVEWNEILRIETPQSLTVELRDGARLFGSLSPGSTPGLLMITGPSGTSTVEMSEIVRMYVVESSFLERLDTNISAGYSYSKATDVTAFNFGLETSYRDAHRLTMLTASSRISDDGEEEKEFNQVTLEHQRALSRKRYWLALLGAEQNDELGFESRFYGGAGLGKHLYQTAHQQFSLDLGLVTLHTNSSDGSSDDSLEGLLRARWRVFDFDTPETDLSTSLALLPGLSDAGEYRANYDVSLKKEIVADLYWNLSFFYRYESRTAGADASNSDYGITTAIGIEL
jgi:hypothetical protein